MLHIMNMVHTENSKIVYNVTVIDVDFPLKGKTESEANKSHICCLKIYFIEAGLHSYTF